MFLFGDEGCVLGWGGCLHVRIGKSFFGFMLWSCVVYVCASYLA